MMTLVLLLLAQIMWTVNADMLYKRGHKKSAYAALYVVPTFVLLAWLSGNLV